MAGDAKLTRLLLGLGLRNFSMHPSNVLMVKYQILQTDLPFIAATTRKILNNHEADRAEALLRKLNQ
jgi:phosphotransferase system enzyme I (PtsI)